MLAKDKDDDRMSQIEDVSRAENSFQNGNFYEWNNSVYQEPSPQHIPHSQDPWILRRPRSRVSRYFCGYNPPETSPPPSLDMKINSTVPQMVPNKESPTDILLNHWRKFLETTSVRGVPKIVLSRRTKQKYLWTVFVIAFFIGCTTCVTLLVRQYHNYDVIHQPRTLLNQSTYFPSVTFCNNRPFSSRISKTFVDMNLMSVNEVIYSYFSKVSRDLWKPRRISYEERHLISSTLDQGLFLMNIPKSVKLSSIGHSLRSMVIKCLVIYGTMSDLNAADCFNVGKWIRTTHEIYLNCYTFTARKEYSLQAKGVELTIYLDEKEDFVCIDCGMDKAPIMQMTGIRFVLHAANTYPEVAKDGFTLSPGTFTDAIFETKRWKMMEPPYGKCSHEMEDQIFQFMEGGFYNYSMHGCSRYKLQTALYERCKCVKLYQIPMHLSHLYDTRQICKFVPQNVLRNASDIHINITEWHNIIKRLACEKNVTNELTNDQCQMPCNYYTFTSRISSGIYPTKSHHLAFAKSMTNEINKMLSKNKSVTKQERQDLQTLLQKLSIYDEIDRLRSNKSSEEEARRRLHNADFIERNFLSININRADFNVIEVEEKAVISLTSFLSQVGGMFSIWSGITFVCFVELIELVMNVMETLFNIKSSRHQLT